MRNQLCVAITVELKEWLGCYADENAITVAAAARSILEKARRADPGGALRRRAAQRAAKEARWDAAWEAEEEARIAKLAEGRDGKPGDEGVAF
jgi:hypothetical protein